MSNNTLLSFYKRQEKARYNSYVKGQIVKIFQQGQFLLIEAHNTSSPQQRWFWDSNKYCLQNKDNADITGLYAVVECTFANHPTVQQLTIDVNTELSTPLITQGLAHLNQQNQITIAAELFWQSPDLWLHQPFPYPYPQGYTISDFAQHPQRPPKINGIVYQRYIPWLQQTLRFRTIDMRSDLSMFNRWMNNPRVADFWEERGTPLQHRQYLEKLTEDPHSQALIACFNDCPFAYFEVYWAKEDRISPFYAAGDYDRGWHLLVGEEDFRGRPWFSAWFPSLQHYLFLDDPRTQCIVAEPRHDNTRLITHAKKVGFTNPKAFDFPHKRAQLLLLLRERFFNKLYWQPQDPATLL